MFGKNLVYKFNCKCGKCYIGQTKRPLRIRRREHRDNIKLSEKYHNVISKHLTGNGGTFNHYFLWGKPQFYIMKLIFTKEILQSWFI